MKILSELVTRHIDNERFVQLTEPFIYYSGLLAKWGMESRVEIPAGFVQDFESIPIIRGRNIRGGTVHDYYSRFDSSPVVTKWQAASLYAEMNKYTDGIDHGQGPLTMIYDWIRRHSKATVVRFWPFRFHSHSVMATCQEIVGIEGDPYVTIEKLDDLIEKTEEVSADLKDIKTDQSPELVVKVDQVVEDLKEDKQKVVDEIITTQNVNF